MEEYLEKNILRQLLLCDQFYTKKEVDVTAFANLLHVCPATLLHDISIIESELEEYILHTKRKKNYYFLYFKDTVPLYRLTQTLLQPSLFLHTCLLYLKGEPDYLQLIEEEFISVSKAYTLKRQVLDFFTHCGIQIVDQHPCFTEMERRLLLIMLTFQLGNAEKMMNQMIPEAYHHAYTAFIEQITALCGRIYNEQSREFLRLGFLVSWMYQSPQVAAIPPAFHQNLKKRPIYDYTMQAWQATNMKAFLNEQEIPFIAALFNCCDYSFCQLQLVEADFQQLHQAFIIENTDIQQLIELFEESYHQSFLKNKTFERALIHLIRSAWDNYQLLLPEKPHALSPCQVTLLHQVKTIFSTWQQQLDYPLAFNHSLLCQFVIELSGMLRLDRPHIQVYIVTDSDVHYLVYKETLEKVTSCHMHISPVIYHQLSQEMKDMVDTSNVRIICERTLYSPDAVNMKHIVPISIDTIEAAVLQTISC